MHLGSNILLKVHLHIDCGYIFGIFWLYVIVYFLIIKYLVKRVFFKGF